VAACPRRLSRRAGGRGSQRGWILRPPVDWKFIAAGRPLPSDDSAANDPGSADPVG